MPPNRPKIDRGAKRLEIVEAGVRLFAADGFGATSMASVAAAASVTKNTVYWYFTDKDALLLACLDHQLRANRDTWSAIRLDSAADRLIDIVRFFRTIEPLSSAVHARSQVSERVNAWHARFHVGAERWLQGEIAAVAAERGGDRVRTPEQVAALAQVWTFAIEGLVSHGASESQIQAVCDELVSTLGH